ncbi:glycosyl transferase group 1 [Stanieria cyanosphaera PCC 7437]|uniref:Glycosyl transferase group 1 n=1 Tax=Stanieria cyanosphaera (strain ATCC 29371 / PCC 7437) TaxID=111780 RepID=K9XYQ8_STAC7|nr:glycosyltransferase [Stanieria cyanosphaera]AFZ37643.1 glycosyl transferase group 1 [Stanieria cyanosphaera PCC 7437]
MKILFVITGLGTGGAEMMLYKILSRINRDKFDPIVLSLMDRGTFGDRIEALNIPVYTLNIGRGQLPNPQIIWKLVKHIHQHQPDLIQGWMYHANLAAQAASFLSLKKTPVLWSIHHSIPDLKLEKPSLQAIIKLSALTSKFIKKAVFSSQTSQLQHQKLGYPPGKTYLIHDSFNTDLFQPSSEAKISVCQELNISTESLLIGLIARFHPMKDQDNFLQAASLITNNYPETHFILVGPEVTPENYFLSQKIKELNLGNCVHLLGERHDTPRLTAALDIATLCSAFGEAFPNVVGEAMCCEVPCVVTDVGDAGLIVGDVGKVIPPKNSEALAKAWQEMIELGNEGRNNLGRQARERIEQNFSLDSVNSAVHKYENLYLSILANKN